jgi:hypothetical protein
MGGFNTLLSSRIDYGNLPKLEQYYGNLLRCPKRG